MFRGYLYITNTYWKIGTYVPTVPIQNIGTYDIENVEFKIEKDFFQQVLREIFDASMTQYAIWHVFGTYGGPPPTRDLTPSSPCSKKLTPSRRSNHRYIAFGRKTGLRILLLRVRESLWKRERDRGRERERERELLCIFVFVCKRWKQKSSCQFQN